MHISHATNANNKWMIISSLKCCCTTHIFHASTQIRYQSIGCKFVVFESEFRSMSYTICCGNSTVWKIININFIRDFPTKSPGFILRISSVVRGAWFLGKLYRIIRIVFSQNRKTHCRSTKIVVVARALVAHLTIQLHISSPLLEQTL